MTNLNEIMIFKFFIISIISSIACKAFSDNTEDVNSLSVCSKQTLSCPSGSVIYVESAHFGMYTSSKCFDSKSLLKTNCGRDVTLFIESRCSGLQSCNLTNNDSPVADYSDTIGPNPCPIHLVRWLEMEYSCKQYYNPEDAHCQTNRPIPVTAVSGLLSSYFTRITEKGSRKCPWSFHVRPSQTLILSLWDLGIYNYQKDAFIEPDRCLIYATINSTGYLSTVCPGVEKKKLLYAKSDGTVTVAMGHGNNVKYLIEFEVLDCSPYNPPSFVSMVKSEKSVNTVRCLEGDEQQHLTIRCENGAWTEVTKRNCSNNDDATIFNSEERSSSSSHSVLLIVAVIAVATVISISIIFIGLYCLRACPFQKSRNQSFDMSVAPQPVAMDKYSSENLFLHSQSMRELYPMLANPDRRIAAGQRDYATTLQMRQMAGYYPEPNGWCPTHGPYYMGRSLGGASTVDRKCNTSKMKRNISCTTPTYGIENNSNKCTTAVASSPPSSPFYHELDQILLRTPIEPSPVSPSDAHNLPEPSTACAAAASVVVPEDGGAKTPV